MDRQLLEELLDRGLSLTEIGAVVGRDPSTVGYWVQKHGLVANGRDKYAPRGGLSRAELEPLVSEGLTLSEIANRVDRSVSTVRHWMAKYGLELARRHGNRAHALAAAEAGQTRFNGTCPSHGDTEFLVFRNGRHRCARCNTEAVSRRRQKVKRTLVREAGGQCVICGFDRHPAALQFHHLDPADKSFGLAHKGLTMGIDRSRQEAGKCVLLCATCHALVEAGVVAVS